MGPARAQDVAGHRVGWDPAERAPQEGPVRESAVERRCHRVEDLQRPPGLAVVDLGFSAQSSIPCATSSTASSERAQSAGEAPRRASRSAVARPIPLEAPVIATTASSTGRGIARS